MGDCGELPKQTSCRDLASLRGTVSSLLRELSANDSREQDLQKWLKTADHKMLASYIYFRKAERSCCEDVGVCYMPEAAEKV